MVSDITLISLESRVSFPSWAAALINIVLRQILYQWISPSIEDLCPAEAWCLALPQPAPLFCLPSCQLLIVWRQWMSSGYIHGFFSFPQKYEHAKDQVNVVGTFPSIIRNESKHETNKSELSLWKSETHIGISEISLLTLISHCGLFFSPSFSSLKKGKYMSSVWDLGTTPTPHFSLSLISLIMPWWYQCQKGAESDEGSRHWGFSPPFLQELYSCSGKGG